MQSIKAFFLLFIFMTKFKKYVNFLGPGLIYAGAAVGVSHLVSATKAGALFNYSFILAIIIIHIIKYQFFKFGPLYTAITGKNILNGYKKVGSWTIYLYIAMTTISMFIIQAAVTSVTSGLVSYMLPMKVDIKVLYFCILLICGIILIIGRYSTLEKISKLIIVTLSIITVIAVALLLFKEPTNEIVTDNVFNFSNKKDLIFLIIFLGWMPAPMEVSVWQSLWVEKKNSSSTKSKNNIKKSMIDFKVGFIGTAILAIFFTILGAKTIYGQGIEIPVKANDFANLLINMYKQALGSSFGIIIGCIAFLTMFSTTLTCLDASPRSLDEAQKISLQNSKKSFYIPLIIINIIGSLIILLFFSKNMAYMIKVATTLAFIATPIFAILNYLAITHKSIPKKYKISNKEKVFSIINIILLIAFNIIYLTY